MKKFFKTAIFSVVAGALMIGSSASAQDSNVQACIETALSAYLECSKGAGVGGHAGQDDPSVNAVDLIGAWVGAGAPETGNFNYTSLDGSSMTATYEVDIAPLFKSANIWYEGSRACASCHFGINENSYHELGFGNRTDIVTGGDTISKAPGVSILGASASGGTDFNWGHSKLRHRLRDNRMPPGWPEDLTEANREGPCVDISASAGLTVPGSDGKGEIAYEGCDVKALDVVAAFVENGAKENFSVSGTNLTYANSINRLFTKPNMWFKGSQACSSCHFAISEVSYHEMNLSSREGLIAGGDTLAKAPGVSLLGGAQGGDTHTNWGHSKLRDRLRNNRMAVGIPFDITEANREGPVVYRGKVVKAITK